MMLASIATDLIIVYFNVINISDLLCSPKKHFYIDLSKLLFLKSQKLKFIIRNLRTDHNVESIVESSVARLERDQVLERDP